MSGLGILPALDLIESGCRPGNTRHYDRTCAVLLLTSASGQQHLDRNNENYKAPATPLRNFICMELWKTTGFFDDIRLAIPIDWQFRYENTCML